MIHLLLVMSALQVDPAAVAPSAAAADTSEDEPAATHVPTSFEIEGAYPAAGFHAGRSGRVRVSCIIGADGSLETCKILEENPKRFNFGWAALAVAFKFRFSTTMKDGRPSEGREVKTTINFVYDKGIRDRAEAFRKAKAAPVLKAAKP